MAVGIIKQRSSAALLDCSGVLGSVCFLGLPDMIIFGDKGGMAERSVEIGARVFREVTARKARSARHK